ncbi:cysteine-rich RLK (receptor-like kinase) protein, putative [Medicago truncatula]|uniref:Cysteine-rich RLK (Receptor-like kinase) protein, putative n=1 Tax=Medicago truncatula TaxID=3880 RepID=G7JSW7_MEDTR|nr:cysteine-rich RLK (receptor-like kinase) protein, putative [Medicago truncatula]
MIGSEGIASRPFIVLHNFTISNKHDQGGFGSVYKGILTNGKAIALNRMSKSS